MMKTKIAFTVLILLCVLFILPSCSGKKYRIALVTDVSEVDGASVSRYAWEGAVSYAEKRDVSCAYYKPSNSDSDTLYDTALKAVTGGAEIVILPGKMFENVCYRLQNDYPDVCFVLLDGQCRDASSGQTYIAENTACVVFEEKDAGFAVGYALVSDGMTAIGFLGMSEDCCAGFLQGADKAASERDLTVNYEVYFAKDYESSETLKEKAEEMLKDGVDVIIAEGEGTLKPVTDAAKNKNGRVVATYIDKRTVSERIITSAVKNYAYVTNRLVTAFFEGGFSAYSGKATVYGMQNGGTGLPTSVGSDSNGNAFDRFSTFDAAAYREFTAKASSGSYGVANGTGIGKADADITAMLGLKNSVYGFPTEETEN